MKVDVRGYYYLPIISGLYLLTELTDRGRPTQDDDGPACVFPSSTECYGWLETETMGFGTIHSDVGSCDRYR
jgi:hypothetical protein